MTNAYIKVLEERIDHFNYLINELIHVDMSQMTDSQIISRSKNYHVYQRAKVFLQDVIETLKSEKNPTITKIKKIVMD